MVKLRVLPVNPSGNKTIFVLDTCTRESYKYIGTKLLENENIDAEQIGFILPPTNGGDGRMEMSGLEFCGNASRSFALYLAIHKGIKGIAKIPIEVSGINSLLYVNVDTLNNYTEIEMPLPIEIKNVNNEFSNYTIVIFEGIIHVVVLNLNPEIEIFNKIRDEILLSFDSPAIGVMFFDSDKKFITPIVWVKDINTTYNEGSCGSGSAAVACVMSEFEKDGIFNYKFLQPEGSLDIILEKENSSIKKIMLAGTVVFGDEIDIQI